jgi:hypothetical protein
MACCISKRSPYQSIGSGGGVKQFTAKTVDFGASDAPLNAGERQAAPGAVQITETIGSVAVAYNIPDPMDQEQLIFGQAIFLRKVHHGIRPLGHQSQFHGQPESVHQVVKVSQILSKVLLTLLDM